MARVARGVTAVEPSGNMLDILHQNIADANLSNIQTVPASWEEAVVEPHDIVVCAHAIYGSRELTAFVGKMERHSRKVCYLAVRLPSHNGIIGELSLSIHGHRHDSPNAIIACNALYSVGIYASMLVENDTYHWRDNTFEEAFARAKRHLRLKSSTTHDGLIRDTLTRRLGKSKNCYIWPDGMRSALLWWSPSTTSSRA